MKDNVLFLPGLNGLRSIAAISVMISHISLSTTAFNLKYYLFGIDQKGVPKGWLLGSHGVTIFFVLSGFLITYLLFLEKEKAKISIKNFYIRRILRIWPIYYLFLIICLSIIICTKQDYVICDILYYLFFVANIPFIFSFGFPLLSHFWSIAVEEQFYIFWPLLLKKNKNFFGLILCMIILLNIFRYFVWWQYPYSDIAIFSIVNRFDCMMIGGLGAILYLKKNVIFLKICTNKVAQIIAWIVMFLLAFNIKFANAIACTSIVTIITLLIIIGQISVENRLINLDLPFFNFIGKISYGIYVYHILVIYVYSNLFHELIIETYFKTFLVYSSVIITTAVIAYISYEYFEKYFLELKNKYSVVKSSAARQKS